MNSTSFNVRLPALNSMILYCNSPLELVIRRPHSSGSHMVLFTATKRKHSEKSRTAGERCDTGAQHRAILGTGVSRAYSTRLIATSSTLSSTTAAPTVHTRSPNATPLKTHVSSSSTTPSSSSRSPTIIMLSSRFPRPAYTAKCCKPTTGPILPVSARWSKRQSAHPASVSSALTHFWTMVHMERST